MDRRSYIALVCALGVGGCSETDSGTSDGEPTVTLPPGETLAEDEIFQNRRYEFDGETATTLHVATYIVEGTYTTVTIYPENTTTDAVAKRVTDQKTISYDLEPNMTYHVEFSNVNTTALTITKER